MTEVGIANDLLFCSETDCGNCSREKGTDCSKKLMRDARSAIKEQGKALENFKEALDELEKEKTELMEKVRVGYTQQQLTEAVNDIIDSFLNGEEYDDRREAQLLAIGSFMRLVRIQGHIAVNCNADRMEIKLDK